MSEAWIAVIGGVITGIFSLIGVMWANRKNSIVYALKVDNIEKAIKKLEDKQDKHNAMIERVYKLEGRMNEAEHDIIDLKRKGA